MINLSLVSLALLIATALVAGFFAYVYNLKRQSYLLCWTAGWCLLSLHFLGTGVSGSFPPTAGQRAVDQGLFACAGILFFVGARLYAQRKTLLPAAVSAGVLILIWSVSNALGIVSVPVTFAAAIIYGAIGLEFWVENRRQETLADWLLAIVFFAWCALGLLFLLFQRALAAWNISPEPLSAVPATFAAMLMVMALYEEEKRRIERNMLALSNLNLATSGFAGGEIHRMLSQALDRVLGVVRLPVGALFLHHGDPLGPTSVVAVGLDDKFCRAAQEEGLDDYLVGLVSSLGGLLGFRDLRDEDLMALEKKDERIRRFRELAVEQRLRSMVAISLQAKEQAFGVLLLGSPDTRRFTPAELRLLYALGHQIGMAVENSLLIQQTSRRSEELHVLNEIGRALSSTLNREDLLRKVWEELGRLFDVENFYIASLDPARDEVQFELEIIGGVRQPRRSRPAGNFLTEYVIRTRQPVLIRERYLDEVRRLNVDPIRAQGCFCGVPLVAYDRAIGAMAVFSDQDKAFDEGHLELLRVLASEASIAIENARLFQDERTKARHLTLLNTISRHAIGTLNPDEMLAKMTEELESGLSYDHIGIAVLDYSTRELVIQAEAGQRRGALGQRVPLGSGLIGNVARAGNLVTFRSSLAADAEVRPMLADTTAAVGLPIFFAEQLHGVLYVESANNVDFTEEEVLLLGTLADLIAGA
ncbi:MAG TPA: GAF domain-containing protein, partial [Candidatus Acidoferrum sp.]|nr:GAF domain-containing protein [Candidatus Acidoferrum sp.]